VARLRDQLSAEADAKHGNVQVEQSLDEEVLLAEPGMVVVLVGMHRAAEDEHRAVVVDRPRRRRSPGEAPLLELVPARGDRLEEHACAHGLAVDEPEDLH